jgi:hypothetical protein
LRDWAYVENTICKFWYTKLIEGAGNISKQDSHINDETVIRWDRFEEVIMTFIDDKILNINASKNKFTPSEFSKHFHFRLVAKNRV